MVRWKGGETIRRKYIGKLRKEVGDALRSGENGCMEAGGRQSRGTEVDAGEPGEVGLKPL